MGRYWALGESLLQCKEMGWMKSFSRRYFGNTLCFYLFFFSTFLTFDNSLRDKLARNKKGTKKENKSALSGVPIKTCI